MKKAKVQKIINRLVNEARNDGFTKGITSGRIDERKRWERYLPLDRDSNITYLDKYPDKLRTVAVYSDRDFLYAIDTRPDRYYEAPYKRIDFEPVPMALTLANGHQIRWFHWKPHGPYPVSELAVL